MENNTVNCKTSLAHKASLTAQKNLFAKPSLMGLLWYFQVMQDTLPEQMLNHNK